MTRPAGGVIRWEPPPDLGAPTTPGARRAWALVAAELRARPGEYGVVEIGPYSVTVCKRINKGHSWFAPEGAFKAIICVVDHVQHVYAVYLGPVAPDSQREDHHAP